MLGIRIGIKEGGEGVQYVDGVKYVDGFSTIEFETVNIGWTVQSEQVISK